MKSITFSLFLAFFLLIINLIFSQDEAWERLIPTPQEHDLYCVRQIPGTDRIVAAGAGSTIMYSDDYGETWEITLNAANLTNGTVFLSICFSDATNGYAVTNDGTIIKTTNGGADWNINFQKDISFNYYQADIHMFNSDTLIVVGIKAFIYKTKDGGKSWDSIATPGSITPFSIDFVNSDSGFVVGYTANSQILRTKDQGDSWTLEDLPIPEIRGCSDIYFKNDSVGFLTGSDYDNNGSPTLYLLKTYDKGNSWSLVYTSGIAYEFGEIGFRDEMNGAIRTFSWTNSFIYTEDGGETWTRDSDSFWWNYNPCNSFVYCPDYLLGVGRFGQIAKSYSMEESWDNLSTNWAAGLFLDVEFTSTQTGYALYTTKGGGVPGGNLGKTLDGGKNWQPKGPYSFDQGGISFIDDNYGFAAIATGIHGLVFRKTVDGAENWTQPYQFTEIDDYYDEPINVVFLDSLNGIVTIAKCALKTEDGGYSWEKILTLSGWVDSFTSIEYLSLDTIFLSCYTQSKPLILKSIDGGETFISDTISFEFGYTKKIYFQDNSVGFLLVNVYGSKPGRIFRTVDGGENWSESIINDTNGSVYNDIVFTSNEIGYAVGEGGYSNALKTSDGGETWNSIDIACSSGFKQLHFFDDWHGLIFGNKGVIIETYSGGVVGLEENPFVANTSNISVFPNPARDKITIQLEEPITNDIYLELFNLQGKCLARKYYPNPSSRHNISLDISTLPPGLYTCRVKSGESYSTSKVVKL